MLALLVGAALRSLVLAAAVWLVLRMPALRNTRLHLTAWTILLAVALLMPVAVEVAPALLPPAPAPIAITSLLRQGSAAGHRDRAVLTREDRPSRSAVPTRDAGAVPIPVPPVRAARWPTWRALVSLAYAVVCCVLLLRLATGSVLAARIARAATPLHGSWTRGHDVRRSETIRAPATFGSVILLPHDCLEWPPTKRLAVIAHEAAHVERHDFHLQLAANLHRAVFWFSPLSWWLRRRLASLAEAVCDDAAIRELQDRSAYAAILLEMAGQAPDLPAYVAMARRATVPARVRRILAGTETQTSRYAHHRALMVGCLVPLVAVATFPVTADPLSTVPNDAAQQLPHRRIAIDPKLLDADVGYYEDLNTGSLMIVTRDGDHLLTGRLHEPRYAEYPYTNHDFFLTELPSRNHFVADASGAAVRVIHRYDWIEEVFERVSTKAAQRRKAEYDRHVAKELLPHTAITLDAGVLANYVGYYRVSPVKIIAISREGAQLFAQTIGEQRFPVFPYTDRDFFYTAVAAQITFMKPADGPATGLILHENGEDRASLRVSAETAAQMQRRWDDERKPHVRVSVDGALLGRYVGRYGNDGSHVEIAREGDHLVARVPDVPTSIIYPYTDHDFFAVRFPTQYSFVLDGDGKAERLVRHSYGSDKILWRIDQTNCRSHPSCDSIPQTN